MIVAVIIIRIRTRIRIIIIFSSYHVRDHAMLMRALGSLRQSQRSLREPQDTQRFLRRAACRRLHFKLLHLRPQVPCGRWRLFDASMSDHVVISKSFLPKSGHVATTRVLRLLRPRAPHKTRRAATAPGDPAVGETLRRCRFNTDGGAPRS